MFSPNFHISMFQIDCDSLFAIDLLNMPSSVTPPKLNQTEQIYQDYLLHGGQVDTKEFYFNNANMGGRKMVPTNFTKIFVENYSERKCLLNFVIFRF